MSRIRSIHPGLFTDPEFVQASMAARMALIGIWTEADDHGVFEWKPLALKMRIFPGDAVDMTALMDELVSAGRIRQADVGGKAYGICRNFCAYQRPKNPSYRWPFYPEWEEYVAIKSAKSDSDTEVLLQPSPSPTENVPQMEDGIGEEKKESLTPNFDAEFPKFWEAYPRKVDRGHALKAFRTVRKAGVTLETLIAGAERYRDDPGRKPEFTKHGSTWLTGQCWLDDAVPLVTTTQRQLRMVPRHEARATLEAAGLYQEPEVKAEYPAWKQKRESYLRVQGIDPRSLTQ